MCITSYAFSQNTVGTITVTNDVYDAYTLFSLSEKTFLINNCGEIINEWSSEYPPGAAVYLLPNGNLLRAGVLNDGSSDILIGGAGGIVELFDWDSNLIWSYTYSSNQYRQHHDIYPLPNGNILMLAISVMSETEAIQAGRNPANLIDNELYSETILELEPLENNQANIVWQWDIRDHLIQDFDNTKSNFGNVGDNPQLLDINFLNGNTGGKNWLHINSIQYDELRDQIILSSRHMSEIYIIDHSTSTSEAATNSGGIYGKGGDFLYRWGNPQAYKQGTSAERTLYGQHTPYFIPDGLPNEGKIILFNNGIERSPFYSQVDIISPPESSLGTYDYSPNSAYLPSASDYTYDEFTTGDSNFFSQIVSNAQQLPNGNILICQGLNGYFFEINPSEEKVWEYVIPIDNSSNPIQQGEEAPNVNITFRAIKYPVDYEAFTNRDVSPNGTIELNPNLTACNNLSIDSHDTPSISLFPNPTKDIVTIKSLNPIDKIKVYNTLGHLIFTSNNAKIDFSNQPNGMYLIKIHSGSRSISKKIIKN